MKYLREVIYLFKNIGFANSLTYIRYRLELKLHNSKFAINKRKRRMTRLEKIIDSLFVYNNKKTIKKGKSLLEIEFKDQFYFLRPFSSDFRVFDQVFNKQEYKPLVDIYNQLFSNTPSLIIDLGANIGLTSVYLSEYYPKANIVAMEPFRESADLAEINLTEHRANFKIVRGGAWDKNTPLSLRRDFRDGKEWSIYLTEDANGEIRGYSLSEILNEFNRSIDILKIDIEGGEKKLFENENYVRSFLKNVKCIAVEIHDEFQCRGTIYKFLKQNHFFYFESGEITIGINKKFIE